jgi:hypothetical protein
VNPHSFFCILGVYPFSKSDDSNVVGCNMSFWDQDFLPRPSISTPSRDINFFGYCSHFGLRIFRRVRSRVNYMKGSSQVDHFVISYRGSTCKLRAEAATLCDTVMARNRFFNINYIILHHKWVQDQHIQTSITSVFIEILWSRFSRACTRTVANVSQNYNFWGDGLGENGGPKKNFSKKKNFFPAIFLHLSQRIS